MGERWHGEIHGIGDEVRARREDDRVPAGEGHGAAAARRDPRRRRIGGAGDLDGFDAQRPGAEEVGEADGMRAPPRLTRPTCARSRRSNRPERSDRPGPSANSPGPNPMRLGAVALRRRRRDQRRDEQGDGGNEVHDHDSSLSATAGSASRARLGAAPSATSFLPCT